MKTNTNELSLALPRLRPRAGGLLRGLGLALGLLALHGCDSGDGADEGEDTALDIAGTYLDEWGDEHTIDETTWTNGSGSFAIASWDDEAMYLIAVNGDGNEFFPGLWSRFDWTWSGTTLYYCQSVYAGEDMDAAEAGTANAEDLAMGCGGFAWTNLTP